MPTASIIPDVSIPNKDIYSFFVEQTDGKAYPDSQVLFVEEDSKRQHTYKDVSTKAKGFGVGLKSMWEWKKGDVLAVFSPNNIDIPVVMFGVIWAGGIFTAANPTFNEEEVAFQLQDSHAKGVVVLPALLPTALKACEKVGIPKSRIITLGTQRVDGFNHWSAVADTSTTSRFVFRRPKIDPAKDIALLMYSSGTSGRPKGVMLSNRNLVANCIQMSATKGLPMDWKSDSILTVLPYFHIYALSVCIAFPMLWGTTTVVCSKFDLVRFCELVQEHRITMTYLAPPVVLALAKHPIVSKYDLSSLRTVNCAAAPLTKDLQEAFYTRLKIPIKQGYGLTETSPTLHITPIPEWREAVGSVGILMPNCLQMIVDENGQEVAPGESGHLLVKGPNIMLGYLNNPEATNDSFTADGWFKTGDVAFTKNNYLYLTDRVKELIKYKGHQVAPATIEGFLNGHPKCGDAIVTGVYMPELASEVPRAYVVPAHGVDPSESLASELSQFIDNKVGPYERLRGGIKFVETIPKSPAGKLLRRVARKWAKDEMERKSKL